MIPKPLVQLNQWFLVITTLIGLLFTAYILLIPFIIGLTTLTTKRNPVILIGAKFLKKPKKSYLQEDRSQQLFNQAIATSCLAISLLGFALQLPIVGYIFSVMVIIAAGVALMGYCIGCAIRYRYMMWRHRQTN